MIILNCNIFVYLRQLDAHDISSLKCVPRWDSGQARLWSSVKAHAIMADTIMQALRTSALTRSMNTFFANFPCLFL